MNNKTMQEHVHAATRGDVNPITGAQANFDENGEVFWALRPDEHDRLVERLHFPSRPPPGETEPTWTDIGTLAQAIAVLTTHADLSHDLLVELGGPLLRRLASMSDAIMRDPHGDSQKP
jgi:hypothetical protein